MDVPLAPKAGAASGIDPSELDRQLEASLQAPEPEPEDTGFMASFGDLPHFAVMALCAVDFFSDVASVSAFAHSDLKEVRILGYSAAACLVVACIVNLAIIIHHKAKYRLVYAELNQRSPCLGDVISLLALSNSELHGLQIALQKKELVDMEQKFRATQAETDLKRFALISQLVEDMPQLALQVTASVMQARRGRAVPAVTIFSVTVGCGMLFVKALSNIILWILRLDAPVQVLRRYAQQEQRKVSTEPIMNCGCLIQLVSLLCSVPLALAFKLIGAPDYPLLQLLTEIPRKVDLLSSDQQALWALLALCIMAVVLLTASSSLLATLALLHREKSRVWHAQLSSAASVALILASMLHPGALDGITIAEQPAICASSLQRWCLWAMPLIRGVGLAAVGLEAIWKEEAPVDERLLIAYTIAATASWMHLLTSVMTTKITAAGGSSAAASYCAVPASGAESDAEALDHRTAFSSVDQIEHFGTEVLQIKAKLHNRCDALRCNLFDAGAAMALAEVYLSASSSGFVDLESRHEARKLLQAQRALLRLIPSTLAPLSTDQQAVELRAAISDLEPDLQLEDVARALTASSKGSSTDSEDAGRATKACWLFSMLCYKSPEWQQRTVDAGGLESVVAVLKAHGSSSEEVAFEACSAIANICIGTDAAGMQRKQRAVDAGALESLVAALKAHGSSSERVASEACSAIANISDCIGTDAAGMQRKQRAFEAGALESLVAALKAHGSSSSNEVAENACSAIRSICCGVDAQGMQRLQRAVDAGALESLVAALKAHGSSSEAVAEKACGAIANICYAPDAAGKQRAAEAGALESLVAALKAQGSSSERVTASACAAIRNICVGTDAASMQRKQRAAEAGALESLVAALKAQGSSSEDVACEACGAIDKICVGKDAAGMQQRIQRAAEAGALESVVAALQTHGGSSQQAFVSMCGIFWNFCSPDNPEAEQFLRRAASAGAPEQMSAGLLRYPRMPGAHFVRDLMDRMIRASASERA